MEKYGVNQLRKMFLDFFESKDHLIMKSFSLVPQNDKSLLLINAGMAPLKPYFTGAEIPPRRRVATCQKCIRTGDIENVGKTARHGTFFEMLGNFSFGDYFKREAIHWSWEFLTEVAGLDPDRLYPSVYLDDDEAFDIWNREIGIAKERIFRFGKEDNFWEHGSGPCGPCSEIYYDRGEKYGCGRPGCTVGCDCDRYMEVWNDVFTQFESDGEGNYTELASKNIDTGMGLERLAVVVQDVDSIFDVDTLAALREKVCTLAGVKYHESHDQDVSIRVITDHIRSATFMIADGIMPTNEGRGYVLRRIIRRAARHGRKLGIGHKFLAGLADEVITGSKDGYPELEEKKVFIKSVLENEESQFDRTIDQGLRILSELEGKMTRSGQDTLAGEEAFRLYDTFGFPIDLTEEILGEKGYKVDIEGFNAAMEEQKERARGARGETNYMGAEATAFDEMDPNLVTGFTGYASLKGEAEVRYLTKTVTEKDRDGKEIEKDCLAGTLKEGEKGTVVVETTPFYATMGGQEGDKGYITFDGGCFEVTDTVKYREKYVHRGIVKAGELKIGDRVSLEVDEKKRSATCRNHSATHLLQKALKNVLGSHVEQKGSLVSDPRSRFDFSHFSAMTPEELRKVEEQVNEEIMADLPVRTDIMDIDEARKTGAMALFGEKYGDKVRVVSMGDYSKELCGGTHVRNTGSIKSIKILSESGIYSRVRRIEALTDRNVMALYEKQEETLKSIAGLLKSTPEEVRERIVHLLAEMKSIKSENEALKSKLANEAAAGIADQVREVKGVKLIAAAVPDADMNALRTLGDSFKEKLGEGVIFLASAKGGKVSLCAMATDGAVKAGAHAGNLIKAAAAIVGGGGGGRPNMASAGGKDADKIPDCVAAVPGILEGML